MFALSTASNTVGNYKGTQRNLQKRMQTELPGIISAISGQWEVVWGPVVWKALPDIPFTGPDNSWFVARSPGVIFDDGSIHEAYVVAIAGTSSIYGGVAEDLQVGTVVDFLGWVASGITRRPAPMSPEGVVPDGTYVANGTAIAAHTLLTEPSPSGTASAGLTLCDFLSGISVSSSTRVVFTGHSLGGVLSPTMALALVRSGILGGEVLVYPTAGPSPGNGSFAELFAQTFPASSSASSDIEYAVWNRNIVNSLDIVPQAWCTQKRRSPEQNLDNIPSIYGLPKLFIVDCAIDVLKYTTDNSNMVYMPLQSRILSGSKPASAPGSVKQFLSDAGENHIAFYSKLFDVPWTKLALRMNDELAEKSEKEEFLGYPVIGDIEWGNEHKAETEAAAAAVRANESAVDDE